MPNGGSLQFFLDPLEARIRQVFASCCHDGLQDCMQKQHQTALYLTTCISWKRKFMASTEAPDYCQLMKISPVEQVFGQWHTIIFKNFLVEATSRSHLIIGVWSIAHQSDVKDLVNKMNCYTEHRNKRYALFFQQSICNSITHCLMAPLLLSLLKHFTETLPSIL